MKIKHPKKTLKIIVIIMAGLVIFAGAAAIIGSRTTMKIITVTRKTTASEQAIWELWANAPDRTRWDDSLEWATINGPFEKGATGEVKLKGQPVRKFEIMEAVPDARYTDRFYLPMGGKMDWHHSITELGDGQREVTFAIEASGPTVFLLGPIMKQILKNDLPPTVEKLLQVAESASLRN